VHFGDSGRRHRELAWLVAGCSEEDFGEGVEISARGARAPQNSCRSQEANISVYPEERLSLLLQLVGCFAITR
jgi:hypothetical protein